VVLVPVELGLLEGAEPVPLEPLDMAGVLALPVVLPPAPLADLSCA